MKYLFLAVEAHCTDVTNGRLRSQSYDSNSDVSFGVVANNYRYMRAVRKSLFDFFGGTSWVGRVIKKVDQDAFTIDSLRLPALTTKANNVCRAAG